MAGWCWCGAELGRDGEFADLEFEAVFALHQGPMMVTAAPMACSRRVGGGLFGLGGKGDLVASPVGRCLRGGAGRMAGEPSARGPPRSGSGWACGRKLGGSLGKRPRAGAPEASGSGRRRGWGRRCGGARPCRDRSPGPWRAGPRCSAGAAPGCRSGNSWTRQAPPGLQLRCPRAGTTILRAG